MIVARKGASKLGWKERMTARLVKRKRRKVVGMAVMWVGWLVGKLVDWLIIKLDGRKEGQWMVDLGLVDGKKEGLSVATLLLLNS